MDNLVVDLSPSFQTPLPGTPKSRPRRGWRCVGSGRSFRLDAEVAVVTGSTNGLVAPHSLHDDVIRRRRAIRSRDFLGSGNCRATTLVALGAEVVHATLGLAVTAANTLVFHVSSLIVK